MFCVEMISHCDFRLRVRYAETDQMGVAYYSNYLIWFEVGRAELCRRRGFTYEAMERETGSFLPVAEAYCRYHQPLRYDQEFMVRTWIKESRRRTVTFAYRLLSPDGSKVHAEGYTKHVVLNREGRPKSFPQEYRHFVQPSPEAGTGSVTFPVSIAEGNSSQE